MKPEFRIQKRERGYVVEYYKSSLFGGKWIHYISAAGLEDVPWHYSTYEIAQSDLFSILSEQIHKNSNERQ